MTDKHETVAKFITNRYDKAKTTQGRQALLERLKRDDRSWRQQWAAEDHFYSSNRAQYHSGISYTAIRAVVNRVMHTLFRNDPPVECIGYDAMDDDMSRMVYIPYTRHQLDEIDFEMKNREAVEYLAKYGTVIVGTPWRQETTNRRVVEMVDEINDKGEVVQVKQTSYVPETTYDNADFVVKDLFNMHYVGKNAMSVKKAEAMYEDNWMSMEELRHYKEVRGWPIFNLKRLKEIGPSSHTREKDEQDSRKTDINQEGLGDTEGRGKFHVILMDGSLPRSYVDKKPKEDYENEEWVPAVAWVAEGVLIYCEETYYNHLEKAYLDCPLIADDLSPYGLSLPYVLHKTEAYTDDTYNMYQDGVQRKLCGMFGAKPSFLSMNATKELTFQPGKMWQALSKDDVFDLKIGEPDPNAVTVLSLLQSQAQLLGGVPRSMQGIADKPAGEGTASEMAMILDQAQINIMGMIKGYEKRILNPFIKRMWQLNRQFKDTEIPKIMRVVCMDQNPESEEYQYKIKLVEKALANDAKFDFRWKGAASMEAYLVKQRKVVQFLEILINAAKIPGAVQQINLRVDWLTLLKRAYEYSGLVDSETIFPINGVEPMIAVREIMQQLQLIMQNLSPEAQKEIMQVMQIVQAIATGQDGGGQGGGQGGQNFEGSQPATRYEGREGTRPAVNPIKPQLVSVE